uniref:ubiquitinyl hydrolase 1 n=1 Tax=Echeneis naucrates TaxID=173247 RepID=A0A665V5K1_ECHNA
SIYSFCHKKYLTIFCCSFLVHMIKMQLCMKQCMCTLLTDISMVLSSCRVAEIFVGLLEDMWLGRSSSCAPVEAKSVLCSILPQFNNYLQQDAQELLLSLLNTLHDNLKKVRQDQNRNCATAPRDSTIVSHLFEGQLSYRTLCMHCNYQTHSTQTFTVLSIPIPPAIIKSRLYDCLSLFFERTVLTGGEQMLCSVCGLRRETGVLTCLEKPPEILMLHLKRWNHAGHLNMGHYTALCHNALSQTWHSFDDLVVREVQDSLVQSPNAYLLLYSRKRFQKPKIHGLGAL